jgi:cytochrome c oxidase subunit II
MRSARQSIGEGGLGPGLGFRLRLGFGLRFGAGLAMVAGLSAGCEGPQRVFNVQGPAARELENLWWWLHWSAVIPTLITFGILGYAIWRATRKRPAPPQMPPTSSWELRFIVIAGAIIPAVLLISLTFRSFVVGQRTAVPPSEPSVTINVIGHMFWWQVQYPDYQFETANEIHIPAGQPVRLLLSSADVIHSFWVPQLHGKADLTPGRPNSFWIQADRPGVYRGQCAEFCGIQHALMAKLVIAEDEESFQAWAERQAQPANEPRTEHLRRGRQVFEEANCHLCHSVRGHFVVPEVGAPGPDLTHLGTRRTLGAVTVEKTRQSLRDWIRDPHRVKPGVRMPPLIRPEEDLDALTDWLMSLD